MPGKIVCSLCAATADLFYDDRRTFFFKCANCYSVFRDQADDLSPELEKKRYLAHNNSPADPGYRAFVDPIIKEVVRGFTPTHHGLDFGAGPMPVIAEILNNKNYKVEIYDPFFHNAPELLRKTYDYIAACEVIEHFREPAKEFKLLRSMLKPGGALFCLTELYDEKADFAQWHYKNDATHRFFYSRQALEWIREKFGFASVEVEGRLVSLTTRDI